MKRIVVLCVSIVLFATTAMAAGGKVAYVDTQAVFDKAKLGKKYQSVVREYYESRKKILDQDADEIQKLQEDFKKQAKVLSEKAQKEKEETLNRKISEFQKRRDDFSSEIGKKNEELSNDFNQQMSNRAQGHRQTGKGLACIEQDHQCPFESRGPVGPVR